MADTGWPMAAARAPGERAVAVAAAAVFAGAAALTIYFARTMPGGMEMAGDWTMAMMWMGMPGESTAGAALLFLLMWLAMMIAMMLPSAMPLILVHRRVMLFRGEPRAMLRTWLVGAGYFSAWTAFGIGAYGLGVGMARLAMASELVSRFVPLASGVAIATGGLWQLTPWKSACLRHCRNPLQLLARHLDGGSWAAYVFGSHHGAYCAGCCWGLMLMLLVVGLMNLPAMIAVAAVIAVEKLLPRGERFARSVGFAAIGAGAWLAAGSLA